MKSTDLIKVKNLPDNTTSSLNGKANTSHNHSWSNITSGVPSATTSAKGLIQLSDAINSTSTTLGATANAVKKVYDKANHSHPYISNDSWLGGLNLEKGTKITYNNSDCLSVNSANWANGAENSNKVGGFIPSYNSDGHSVVIRDVTGKVNSHTFGRDRNGSNAWAVLEGAWTYIRSRYGGDGIIFDNEGYYRPVNNDGWSSGRDGYRWHTIWYNRYNGTSDDRLKNNIQYIGDETPRMITFENKSIPTEPPKPSEFYNFFKDEFKACRYQYNLGRPEEEKDTCLGFLAQDLLKSKVGRAILNEESTRKYEEQQEKYKENPEILQRLLDKNRNINLKNSLGYNETVEISDDNDNLPNEDVACLSYSPSDYITAVAIALQEALKKIAILESRIDNLEGVKHK